MSLQACICVVLVRMQSGPGFDPSVAVHVDGVYIARMEAILGHFIDVERIEVLRGPQGTLYGRNAAGGSINIISKDPTDEFSASGAFTAGNYDKQRYEFTASGPLSDNLGMRLSALRSSREGFIKNVQPLNTGDDSYDDENVEAVRGMLVYTPNDDGQS